MSAPASCSKRPRGPAARGEDRLSSLPDPLLHIVMSFLPMPEVVRMSLLSPRWRYLWASVPFIHLDYKDFVNVDDNMEKRKVDQNRLEKFGDQLLLLRDGTLPLSEARILLRGDYFHDKCRTWIHHAIRHKARLLHVYGPSPGDVIFCGRLMIPSQHLKKIKLHMVSLLDTCVRTLNFDFPVLEHLELEYCQVYWSKKKVSSRSLKTISITYCGLNGSFQICAPNLNHLSILYPTYGGSFIVTRDLHSLVTASISLRSSVYGNEDKILDAGILDGLSHVRTLELHAPLHEPKLERSLPTCPVFSNLTSLVLAEWCMASNIYPLLFILRRSPKLKDLTFKLKMEQSGEYKDAEHNPSPREELPSGGYPSIERTVIYCGKDDPRVSALVKVLLPIVIPGGEISIKGH